MREKELSEDTRRIGTSKSIRFETESPELGKAEEKEGRYYMNMHFIILQLSEILDPYWFLSDLPSDILGW